MTGAGASWLSEMQLPQHNLTRHLRVRLSVADGAMVWVAPRTIMGVVPIGVRRLDIPVDDIAAVRLSDRILRPQRLPVAAALIALPPFFLPWWLMVPLIPIGLWMLLVSLGPRLEAETRSGRTHRAAVCFGHKIDAEVFIAAVEDIADEAQAARADPPEGNPTSEPGPER